MNKKTTFDFAEGEVLLIDKPIEWTSFGIVKKIRNAFKLRKIGHAGTLDPLATGLLILCTGKMTKKINEYTEADKEYTGKIILGKTTPSFDLETEVNSERDISGLTEDQIKKATIPFTGNIIQTPPAYSAIRIEGVRSYKMARRGEEVSMRAREVNVNTFEITNINLPEIDFRVVCSKGTYIRSLVNDFGESLGVGAYLSALRRTRIGEFHVDDAYNIEEIVGLKKKRMKVYRSINSFNKLKNAVVTSGIFDGVHKGHQKILSDLVKSAKESGGETVVITFWPHPKKVLHPELSDVKHLTTLRERTRLIEENKIDHLLIIPFTKEFSTLTSDEFVKDILINKVGTKKLVIGYDHKFGKNREGSFEYLKSNSAQLGFEVEEIPRQDIEEVGVSSTLIRNALTEGKVKDAATYLGRPYSMTGTVVRGKKLGRTIGYPTANLKVYEAEKLIPKDGIYAVKVTHDNKTYGGMMSIGFNPTVKGKEKTIEVNIFDFSSSIYDEKLEIEFIEYLRDEEKFDGLEELKAQLAKDKEESLKILN